MILGDFWEEIRGENGCGEDDGTKATAMEQKPRRGRRGKGQTGRKGDAGKKMERGKGGKKTRGKRWRGNAANTPRTGTGEMELGNERAAGAREGNHGEDDGTKATARTPWKGTNRDTGKG